MLSQTLPVHPVNYHAQHSPFGAHASFTLGLAGGRGGFGQSLSGPASQNVFVGWRDGDSAWNLLPFFEPTESLAALYTGETQASNGGDLRLIPLDAIDRKLGVASDTWISGPLTFSLLTPFQAIAEPDEHSLLPAIWATLRIINTSGAPIDAIFGVGGADRPWRPLSDTHENLAGFAVGTSYGFATIPAENIRAVQSFSVFSPPFVDETGLHRIAHDAALIVSVASGETVELPIALGFFVDGVATTGITTRYSYARHFADLETVLEAALDRTDDALATARKRDDELENSGLSESRKWLLAQSIHSYYGSTQCLTDTNGETVWVVHEGEYRMMNTFDLTVDHLFFELAHHPWAVQNTLDLFASRYAYTDTIHTPDGARADGGVAFTHDMGVANQFTPPGRSSYECHEVDGCFSQMTAEELLNWILCAVIYGETTGETGAAWLSSKADLLRACAESLLVRDHPDPTRRTGQIQWDSDRCGPSGAEITTYDSLDISLGQTRNNIYMGVKALGAWVLLERVFAKTGDATWSSEARDAADRAAETICAHFDDNAKMFPAVFENDNASRILPAIEGLAYPLYLGLINDSFRERFADLLEKLGAHLENALAPGVCLDSESGGWKLSSTSHNTWFSKIALCQWVASELFPESVPEIARGASDDAHVAWLKSVGCRHLAMVDQIHSATGDALGSRYYPRGVTAWLWLGRETR